ncbi:MAG: inovirus-type Gp2 protein [Gammaproteobacteria bacterium]|nr:inovirus-type Gp2 protein [Gammaproteobacteria bacterium]
MVNTLSPEIHQKPAKGSLTNASKIVIKDKSYDINTHYGKYEVRTDILWPMVDQLEAMLSYHSKVYQIRLEAHSKHYDGKNKEFTSDLSKLLKWLKGKGHKRVAYCWVREKDRSKHFHYHLVLWLNGHIIDKPRSVYMRWDTILGATQEWVRSTPMIHRNKPETHSKGIYTASYLAKQRTKGYGDKGTRDFSTSQLKPNVNSTETVYDYAKRTA